MGRMSSCHSAKLWALRQIKNGKDQDGPKLVVGSVDGADQLFVFVNAMNEIGKIFESPVKLEKKAFKFEPLVLAA